MKLARRTLSILFATLTAQVSIAGPIQWAQAVGGNDHYYELITDPVGWTAARNAAVARSFNGLQGYLASVTSAPEHSFVLDLIAGQPAAWLGGTDLGQEGTWTWVDGPEDGQIFYQNGSATSYTAFPASEPNGGTGENGLETGFFGTYWNDRPESQEWAYVVEYGGLQQTPPVPVPATGVLLASAFGILMLRKRRGLA